MVMAVADTRKAIVECADQLFYQQGFTHTSFASIAAAVGISRGNFYHHFKSKDDILHAVLELRLERTRELLQQWQQDGETPKDRLCCFIKILTANWAKIKLYGCPVGSLTLELSKIEHPALGQANKIFEVFREWLEGQFRQAGLRDEANEYSMRLLAFSQGVATVASAYRDKAFVEREIDQMCEWVQSC